jgi:hypothetical protein
VEAGDDAANTSDGYSTTPEGGGPDGGDAADEADAWDAADADAEADAPADASDADAYIAPPSVSQVWVHWVMPNPDAAIGPGSEASLPNPMTYAPGGPGSVLDVQTGLQWELGAGTPAASYLDANSYCAQLPPLPASPPWRVPTRIELVSLIDFTRVPMLDVEAFVFPAEAGAGAGGGTYWSSSVIYQDADPTAQQHWVVSFTDGMVVLGDANGGASFVRCVIGGGP